MVRTGGPDVRVIAQIPAERVTTFSRNGRLPRVGELAYTEQCWTEGGRTMIAVYCLDPSGEELWAADIFESELETASEPASGA